MNAKQKIPSDKGSIAAVIHYPEKETGRLSILCPGNVDSKDYDHLVRLATDLCAEGYTVVRFDPTGTWDSDGDISDYTMTQYLEDIKYVLEYMLKENPFTHILLGGHSRGGQMSLLYAARDQRISLVVGIMPSSGPITGSRRAKWKETGVSISERDLPNNKNGKKIFRIPYSHVEDRDKYDVVSDAQKITAPIILITGELDNVVLPEDVREIFDNAHEPKLFENIPNIGHDYRFNDHEIAVMNHKILELIHRI